MADKKWTDEQESVITLRGRDILVSAAAGSGKTAVLIERILARITDADAPVDIDRILVVTFTRAAAREMKERLYRGISERMGRGGDDNRLARQLVLLANSQITTIDSFCISLIREYFETLSIDPDLRIADSGELKLLSAEVWEDILEDEYNRADPDFLALTDLFSRKGRDDALLDILERLYKESTSYPWPKKWLEGLLLPVSTGEKDFEDQQWFVTYKEYFRSMLSGIKNEYIELMDEVKNTIKDHPYLATITDDIAIVEELITSESIEDLVHKASNANHGSLSTKKVKDEDAIKRDEWKNRRNALKGDVKKLIEEINAQPYDTIEESLKDTYDLTAEFVRLVERFTEEYGRQKNRRGIMDFSDAEHLALKLIVNEDGSDGPAASILRDRFAEIMVDEYQDTNELQEYILKGLSGSDHGRENYFMVGDVKQSIYRFRQARPEIFAGKYETFTGEPSAHQRIDLSYNFRSRSAVIDTVNDVFERMMHADMGGVEYDEAARLAQYIEDKSGDDERTEICLINKDDPVFKADHYNGNDAEALIIAKRIRSLMKDYRITDRDTGEKRPLRYGDIAILNRGANKIGERLCEILSDNGIPAQTASGVGYFQALEVRTVLAVIALIVNPERDIEMAAVLKSPLVGMSDEDLAGIRAAYPDMRFYEAVTEYAKERPDSERIVGFMDLLRRMRELSYDTPIHELLTMIYKESGYMDYVRALPKGENRAANLEMLYDLAVQYEKTSYSGPASFIGYIEKQKEYEIDHASSTTMASENFVQVMTIHKSKGLEFPVVILSGIAKKFNENDQKGDVIIHPRYGLGIKTRKYGGRVKLENIHRRAVVHFTEEEDKGEELRVLYVAMTRAKNKLILVGNLNESLYEKAQQLLAKKKAADTGYRARYNADCYLDWILPVIIEKQEDYDISFCDASGLADETIKDRIREDKDLARIACEKVIADHLGNEVADRISEACSFVYPHETANRYKNKYSVSDIKHEAILQNMEEAGNELDQSELPEFMREEKPKVIPRFLGGESEVEENQGALRGVAMHRFLECFDFSREDAADSFDAQIIEEIDRGLLTDDQRKLLSEDKLRVFLSSDLADRMMKAARCGCLFKEHAFVMEHEMEPGVNVLVQGIIDAFFEEDDGIVLLDYKTDKVRTADELTDRYKAQVDLYAEAISRAKDKPVKERYLYSFSLSEAVRS